MSERIEPALTPEEWAGHVVSPEFMEWDNGEGNGYAHDRSDGTITLDGQWRRHEIAARLLYGQPFGFTWEDVDALRAESDLLAHAEDADPFTYQEAGRVQSIADRIAALLPPREDG